MKQYIYGKNTIMESLKGEKVIYQIYMAKNVNDERILFLAKKRISKFKLFIRVS